MKWNLETRKISSLKDYHKNPRKLSVNDAAHLQKSLEKFGLIDKPIINSNGTIIGGHQRKNLLKKIGVKEIECWVPERDLDENEIQELNIRLNKNVGDWDYDVLANEWEATDLIEWGFTPEELTGEEVEQIDPQEEDEADHTPEEGKEPITKLGDSYDLESISGKNKLCHRVICGDSTDPDVVSRLLEGREPILMVTDPPYGVEYDPEWRKEHNKNTGAYGKVENDDRVNWALAWHLFPGSVAYVWHAPTHASEVHKSLIDSDYQIVSNIIWNKQHFALSRGDYHWKHESCWYSVKKGHSHNWQGSRKECTVWDVANLNCQGKSKDEDDRTEHSTQKPLECMSKPIRNNSAPGEEIYDPFLGSGTTLIACEQLDRVCYGVELSPNYCDVIVSRWQKYMQKNGKEFTIKKNGEEIKW